MTLAEQKKQALAGWGKGFSCPGKRGCAESDGAEGLDGKRISQSSWRVWLWLVLSGWRNRLAKRRCFVQPNGQGNPVGWFGRRAGSGSALDFGAEQC